MKYIIKATNQFKKDLKAIVKRGLDRQLILDVIELLAGAKCCLQNIKTII